MQELSRELHDGIGQLLTAARLMADGTPECPLIISELLTDAMQELQRISNSLAESTVVDGGLSGALHELAIRTSELPGRTCSFEASVATPRDTGPIAKEVYRIAQEAVGNSIRHSGGSQLHIELRQSALGTLLIVEDNGVWAQPDEHRRHSGLENMAARSRKIGGTLEVRRGDEQRGTRVKCWVPNVASEKSVD